jgi:hypothetical protein
VPATSSSPSSLLSVAEHAELSSRHLSAVESITLIRALEAVPDHRSRQRVISQCLGFHYNQARGASDE